ncbi:hypothetical protein AVEN_233673-1, partial [Araneus ventricosus]
PYGRKRCRESLSLGDKMKVLENAQIMVLSLLGTELWLAVFSGTKAIFEYAAPNTGYRVMENVRDFHVTSHPVGKEYYFRATGNDLFEVCLQ